MSSVSARNRYNKVKGSGWETDNVAGFRKSEYEAERMPLSGKDDQGDLYVRLSGKQFWVPWYFVAETKNVKTVDLAGFTREAVVEADNWAKARGHDRRRVLGGVILKRRMKSWEDAYVITTVREMFLRGHE